VTSHHPTVDERAGDARLAGELERSPRSNARCAGRREAGCCSSSAARTPRDCARRGRRRRPRDRTRRRRAGRLRAPHARPTARAAYCRARRPEPVGWIAPGVSADERADRRPADRPRRAPGLVYADHHGGCAGAPRGDRRSAVAVQDQADARPPRRAQLRGAPDDPLRGARPTAREPFPDLATRRATARARGRVQVPLLAVAAALLMGGMVAAPSRMALRVDNWAHKATEEEWRGSHGGRCSGSAASRPPRTTPGGGRTWSPCGQKAMGARRFCSPVSDVAAPGSATGLQPVPVRDRGSRACGAAACRGRGQPGVVAQLTRRGCGSPSTTHNRSPSPTATRCLG
jgi:hypothetical protein